MLPVGPLSLAGLPDRLDDYESHLLPSLTPGDGAPIDSYELPHLSILGFPEGIPALSDAPRAEPEQSPVPVGTAQAEADWPIQSVETVFPSVMGEQGTDSSLSALLALSAASLFAAMGGDFSPSSTSSAADQSEAGGGAAASGGMESSVDGGGSSRTVSESPVSDSTPALSTPVPSGPSGGASQATSAEDTSTATLPSAAEQPKSPDATSSTAGDDVASAPKGGPHAPVLDMVLQVSDRGEGQIYVQGRLDLDIPEGVGAKIEFYSLSGKSATLIGTAPVSKAAGGGAAFTAILEGKLMPGDQVVARAVGDFKGAGAVSLPYQVKAGHDRDSDGVDGEIEDLARGGDGNRDGIPDSLQADVASLLSQAKGEFVTLDGRGRRLTGVQVSPLGDRWAGLQKKLPYGQFEFVVADVPVGGVSRVDVILPEGEVAAGYYKLDPGTERLLPFVFDGDTGAVVSGNVVSLFLRDGGRGDADGVTNGVIVDPGFPHGGEVRLLCTGETGLDGWNIQEFGGSENGRGSVAFENSDLVMREGDSFLVTLETDFEIPANATELTFKFSENLDRTDVGFIKDAFEVALLDAQGCPLVTPFKDGRDAYFNMTEGEGPQYQEPAVGYSGQTLTADLSELEPGSTVHLVMRLINEDGDTGSEVTIDCHCAPIALDDEYEVKKNVALVVPVEKGVLANDWDPDAGSMLAALVVDEPDHGVLEPNSDGSFTYTPALDYVGEDTFTYKANDQWLDSEIATVSLTITSTNNPPVLAFIGNRHTDEEATLEFTVTASDLDLPNDTLTITASGLPSGASFEQTTGTSGVFSWTPTEAQGPHVYKEDEGVTFTVTDNGQPQLSDSETIKIQVYEVNEAPELGLIGNQEIDEGSELEFTLTATDPDLPANTLTFSAVGLPDGATLDATTGDFSWTPTEAQGPGTYLVTFTVTDDGDPVLNDYEEITITVSEAPGPPRANDDSYTISEDSSSVLFDVLSNDTALPDTGETLTIIDHGSGSAGGTIDIENNSIRYTPPSNFCGKETFTYTINDGTEGSNDTATVTVTVEPVNDAPAGTNNTVTTLEDTAYTFASGDFGFTDPLDDPPHQLNRVKISSLPVPGTLKRDGDEVDEGDFVTVAEINAGDLTFHPAANGNGAGYASFTFQVEDNGGVANGGVNLDQSANTMTVNVTPVNDAPAGTDNAVTTLEDTAYTFAAGDFGFTDPLDNPADEFSQVEITRVWGGVTLKLDGVPVSEGDFVAVADVTAHKLTLHPAQNGSGTGYASFTFQVKDDGGVANGGVNLDQSPNTMTVNVTPVNDAPAGTDNAVITLEDTPYVFVVEDFGFADPLDNPPNQFNRVKISSLPEDGTLKLDGEDVDEDDFVTVAEINAGDLAFYPEANEFGSPYTTFTFRVEDDGGVANGGVNLDQSPNTMTVNVTAVNSPPAGTDKTVTTLEDMAYTFAVGDFGFTDPLDDPPHQFNRVKISSLPASGTGTLKLDGEDVDEDDFVTVAEINAGDLTFHPPANANGTGYASFTFQVEDDGGTADGGVNLDQSANTMTVNVTPVNDAPAGTNNTVTTLEDTAYTFAAADFGFTDPLDSPANQFSRVTISSLPAPGTGTLKLNDQTLAEGASVAVADISAGKLKFHPAANANGTGYASFTFQVRDDGGVANGGVNLDQSPNTMTVNVTPVNDAPAGTNNTVTTLEDTAYVFAAADFGFTDPLDNPPDDFNRVKISSVPESGTGTLKLDGEDVEDGDFVTVAEINAGDLAFYPEANEVGSPYTTFTFQVEDDGGVANGGVNLDPSANTMTVNVTPVNSPPAGTDKTVTTLEDTAYTFAVGDFGFTDPLDDPPHQFNRAKITTVPAGETLKLDGVAVGADDFVTVANVTAGKLKFHPPANANGTGYASFTFQVEDDGGVANGGVNLDQSANTMTVNVTPVNDPPAGTNNTVTTAEDTAYVFAAGDFGFTDPLDSPANQLSGVKIATLPAPGTGTLKLDGVLLVAGVTVTAAEISASKLTFHPAADAYGSPYTTFTFQVEDNGGVANGGVNLDQSPNTMTVNVTAVPDPVLNPIGDRSIDEEEELVFTVTATDPDLPGEVLTFTAPERPTGANFQQTGATSGEFSWTPSEAQGPGVYYVTFTVTDDDSLSDSETIAITVYEVNKPPELATVGNKTVGRLSELTFTLVATDPDVPANSLAFSSPNLPAGATLDPQTGVFGWTPSLQQGPGTYSVTFVVTDNGVPVMSDSETITITVTAAAASKFFVVDHPAQSTFFYGRTGEYVQDTGLSFYNSNPRGIASNAAGDRIWVIDGGNANNKGSKQGKSVFVYDGQGHALYQWQALGLNQPEGITTDGTNLWIVDNAQDKVFYYANAASRTGGSQEPTSSFLLHQENQNAYDLVTDGTKLWVIDDYNNSDSVFVYTVGGTSLGHWWLGPESKSPSGITLNPSGGSDLWTVDHHNDRVYYYPGGRDWVTGTHAAPTSFPLDPDNKLPQGIADPLPVVKVDSVQNAEEGVSTGYVRLWRDSTSGSLAVNYSIGSSTYPATNGTDFAYLNGQITFPSGQATVDITVDPTGQYDDSSVEQDETVRIDLQSSGCCCCGGGGYTLGSPSTGTLTIVDDDEYPVVSVQSVLDAEEGVSEGYVRLSRDITAGSLTVNFCIDTSSNPATNGTDFEYLDGQVTFPSGQATVDIPVDPTGTYDDLVVEGDETVKIVLQSGCCCGGGTYTLGSPSTGTLTIVDNDEYPVVSVQSVLDAEEGVSEGYVRLLRDVTTGSLTVYFYIDTSTNPATNGTDFEYLNGQVTFSSGQSTVDISVDPTGTYDDLVVEGDETVRIVLQSGCCCGGGTYTLGTPSSATLTIAENDVPSKVWMDSVLDAKEGVSEGYIRLRRDITVAPVTVQYSIETVEFSATNGIDFAYLNGQVAFSTGQATADISVDPTGPYDDLIVEGNELVRVELQTGCGGCGGGSYVLGAPSSATLTIVDDEPTVWIDEVQNTQEGANPGYFLLRRNQTAGSLTVRFAIDTDISTADNGVDFASLPNTSPSDHHGEVTFPDGEDSIDISVNAAGGYDDAIYEGDETVSIFLEESSGCGCCGSKTYAIGSPNRATLTIADNEPIVWIDQVQDAREDVIAGYFRLRRDQTAGALAVNFTVDADGSPEPEATAGFDFDYLPETGYGDNVGLVTFQDGQESIDIFVDPTGAYDDDDVEPDETVGIQFNQLEGGSYGVGLPAAATLKILEDDVPVHTWVEGIQHAQEGVSAGYVRLRRDVATEEFTVHYYVDPVRSTAINGTDFGFLPGTDQYDRYGQVTFAASEETVDIWIDPTGTYDDAVFEGDETVRLMLMVTSPASVSVKIADDEIRPVGPVDASHLVDVTPSIETVYHVTSFNDGTEMLYAQLTLTHVGSYSIRGPVLVGVKNLSTPLVQVEGIDGVTPDGIPYYNISSRLFQGTDRSFDPGESLSDFYLEFFNPEKIRFTYELVIFGYVNQGPEFTTSPVLEVAAGGTYRYDADASDPEDDELEYRMLIGPETMDVDLDTGEIVWETTTEDAGLHSVLLRVSDPEGLYDEQSFDVFVTEEVPNRPPWFTSTPVVDAYVNVDYAYLATAQDPDGDQPLVFSLVAAVRVSDETPLVQLNPLWQPDVDYRGLVTWDPPVELVGQTISMILKVDDGHGGTAEQPYRIYVHPEPGNQPPWFVSKPTLTHVVPGFASPASGKVTPQAIDLELEPGETYPVDDPETEEPETTAVTLEVGITGGGFEVPTGPENQLTVFNDTDKNHLSQMLLLGGSSGLVVRGLNLDEQHVYSTASTGYYVNNNETYGMSQYGIVLSSGNAADYHSGNNTSGRHWYAYNTMASPVQEVLLDSITGGWYTHFDVTQFDIEFDLLPGYDTLTFNLVFGSEEYPEWVGTEFVDGFGLFVDGENIAFVDGAPVNIDHPYMEAETGTELDGVLVADGSPVLTFTKTLTAGSTGHKLTFIVCDTSDAYWDTTVFISNLGATTTQPIDVGLVPSEEVDSFTNETGVVEDLLPGDLATFQVYFTGGTTAEAYELEFHDITTTGSPLLGWIPVSINNDYFYPSLAVDPDKDVLTYSLAVAPLGATIDSESGLIRWDPPAADDYPFVVRADDGHGGVAQQPFILQVIDSESGNDPPTIAAIPDLTAQVARPLMYAVDADDPDGDALKYYLAEYPDGMSINSDTGVITWLPVPGQDDEQYQPYTVSLLVSDRHGGEDPETFEVTVLPQEIVVNEQPEITSTEVTSAVARQVYLYPVTAEDADADKLTFALAVAPEGAGIDPDTGHIVWFPGDEDVGWHPFGVTVEDGRGGADSQFYWVEVTTENEPPAITSQPVGPAALDELWTYQVVASDPNGDALTHHLDQASLDRDMSISTGGLVSWTPEEVGAYRVEILVSDGRGGVALQSFTLDVDNNGPPQFTSVPTGPAWVGEDDPWTYAITVPDPNPQDTVEVTLDQASIDRDMELLHVDGQHVLSWTPLLIGDFEVTLTATDGQGGYAMQWFTLPARAPRVVSLPPEITSTPTGPAYVGQDPPWSYTIAATDPDDDDGALAYTLQQPSGAQGVTFNQGTHVLTWTPSATGSLSFTLRVTDPHGSYTEQTFTVPAEEDEPTLQAPEITSVPTGPAVVGETYQYQVVAYDPNGDELTYSVTCMPPVTGLSIGEHTGLLVWDSPEEGDDFEIEITVSDGTLIAEQEFNLDVVAPNSAPRITSVPTGPAYAEEPWSYTITATDAEDEEETLVYTLEDPAEPLPSGVEYDSDTHTVTWTASAAGNRTFTVRVEDSQGAYAELTFTVTAYEDPPAGQAPVITSEPTGPALVGEMYRYQVVADDPNDDELTYSVTSTPSVTGLSIGEDTGLLVWDFPQEIGEYLIEITVSDGTYDVLQTFTLPAVEPNIGPRITSVPEAPAYVGQTWSYTVGATDADDDEDDLVYTLEQPTGAQGVTFNQQTQVLTWLPTQSGQMTFTLRVTDPHEAYMDQTFTLPAVAAPQNLPPVIRSLPPNPMRLGSIYSYAVDAYDPNGDSLSYDLDAASLGRGMRIDVAGLLTWRPDVIGDYPVTIVVDDGTAPATEQEFTLNVLPPVGLNDPPEITSHPTGPAIRNCPWLYQATATDPNGDTITWSLDTSKVPVDALGDLAISSTTGLVTWTPLVQGDFTISVIASDEDFDVPQTFTLPVLKNAPPEITSDAVEQGKVNVAYSYPVEAVDPNPGDTLTYSLASYPSDMTINQTTGLISWPPSVAGSYSVAVVVADQDGATDSQSYTLTIGNAVNKAPEIWSDPRSEIQLGQRFLHQVDATDDDGDDLTYELASGPAGMTMDTGGLIDWTPTSDDVATSPHNYTIQVSDGVNSPVQKPLQISVVHEFVNHAPEFTSTPRTNLVAGERYLYDANATDPDRDSLTYGLGASPQGMTIDSRTGLVEWRPTMADLGEHPLEVRVVDALGAPGRR